MLLQRVEIVLDRVVDAQVDDLEAGAFHHHADQVLADVVDVALDRADHHLADLLGTGLGQQGTQDDHAGLHGAGRQEDLRHEEDAVAEVDSHDPHAFDQGLGQNIIRHPAAFEQNIHALFDLFLETVIEVVHYLLDEFLVVERP